VLLFGIEASFVAPAGSAVRAAAGWCWIAVSALLLACVLGASLAPLRRRSAWSGPDAGWYLAALLVPVLLVLWGIGGYAHTAINDEAVQQVTEGLRLLRSRPGPDPFGTGFLGYPGRQYLLSALPSLVFGRGVAALRLGYGALYIVGYVAFLAATRQLLEARQAERPRLLASLAGMLAALGSYPLLYARLFEQTLVPLALTFLFLAGLASFLARPGLGAALVFAWALGFMPYAYTPALASWMLGMAVLAVLVRSSGPAARRLLGGALAYGLVTFALAPLFAGRTGALPGLLEPGRFSADSAAGYTGPGWGPWVHRLAEGLHAAVGAEESLVPAPLTLGILFILLHSLRRGNIRVLLLGLWAGGTVVLALVLKGYWQRVPEFDLHRAMVVLPALSLALVLYLAGLAGSPSSRAILVCGLLYMLLNAAGLPLLRRAPRAYYPFEVTDAEEAAMLVVDHAGPDPRTIYLAPPLFFPLETTLAYFRPAVRVVHAAPPPGEHQPGAYVVYYAGTEPFVGEDPTARYTDHPQRFAQPRPYLAIRPE